MKTLIKRMVVMSAALVLLCVCAVAQNENNVPTNKEKSATNAAVINSSGITFNPSPCFVYAGEKVDVFVTLPAGYDDIQIENNTNISEYHTAEICLVNNRLAIRVRGKADKIFTGIIEETIIVSAIKKKNEYETRSNNSYPTGSLTVLIAHK